MQWTAEKVLEEVSVLLQPHNPDGVEITMRTDLAADLNMDSVAAMNLIMEIEDKFGLDIPISDLPEVNYTEDLVKVVLEQLNK